MARAKRRNRPASLWTEEVTKELLAWAEYCRRRDSTGRHFEKTIVRHLQDCTGVRLSWDEIDGKIQLLAKHARAPLKFFSYDRLYKSGDSLIRCVIVDREAYKLHQQRVKELIDNGSSRPKLRNPAGAMSALTIPSNQPSTIVSETNPPLRKGNGRTRRYRSRRKSIRKSAATTSTQQDELALEAVLIVSDTESEIDQALAAPMEAFNSSKPFSLLQRPGLSQVPEPSDTGMTLTSDTLFNTFCTSSEYSNACNNPGHEDIIKSQAHDIAWLRRQLEVEREQKVEIKARLQSQEAAHALLEDQGSGDIDKIIEEYEQELAIYKTMANDKASLGSFIRHVNDQLTSYDVQGLRDLMNKLHFELRHILMDIVDHEIQIPPFSTTAQPDLGTLLHRIFGDHVEYEEKFSCSYIVRALISAAVCEWVFECELQETYIDTNPLAERMLSQITTLDGAQAAKALHFSANQSLINEDYFQEQVIPRRAMALAGRMHKLLVSSICADVRAIWRQQIPRLLKIFTEALKVKASVLVCNDIFEVVFPPVGTVIKAKSNRVTIERHAALVPTRRSASTCIVQLPLAPGLRSQSCERTLVDYNSFRKPLDQLADDDELIVCPRILERPSQDVH